MPVIAYDVDAGVATIALDSPANRNALSAAVVGELTDGLNAATADDSVRAVVLTHTGSTFCSGNDMREASEEGGPQRSTARMLALFRLIVELPKPVIVRITGHARAGGVGLVGASDIAIAGPGATFSFTEARLGLAPAVISLTTLSRLPERAASRYLLTGDVFDGRAAETLGLVTEYYDSPEQVDAAIGQVLDALRACSPQGLAETKPLTTARMRAAFDERGAQMQQLSARLFASEQGREGMRAALERRRPSWAPTD